MALTRGRVCNLQLLLGLASAVVLGSEFCATHDQILSQIWDSPNPEGQVPVFISPRNMVAELYPKAFGFKKPKSKSHYERQSVGQSVLVSGAHLGPATNFSFSLSFTFRQLAVWYFVASSLTRGRVCNLLLLLVLASAVPLVSALSDERSGLSFVSFDSISL
jgi:hypothetical protein